MWLFCGFFFGLCPQDNYCLLVVPARREREQKYAKILCSSLLQFEKKNQGILSMARIRLRYPDAYQMTKASVFRPS